MASSSSSLASSSSQISTRALPSCLPSTSSSGQEMSPDLALRLFKEGASFVFLNVPVGTEIGIDLQNWNTGEKFRGIKMIPPGLHFLYFSSVSKDLQNMSPRSGFFHFFLKQEMVVRKYDPIMEVLSNDVCPENEVEALKSNMEELDRFLGAYPYDMWRKWISLTSRITPSILEKLNPPGGMILSAPELTLDADQTTSKSSKPRAKMSKLEQAEDDMPKMTETFESKIRYSWIPTENYPAGSTPAQITKCQMDTTWKLDHILEAYEKQEDLLAELQYAFVNFLVGQSYSSFEHWKRLVQLVCQSDEAIVKYPKLYTEFVSDLYFQIGEVPQDFFVDIVTCNNFLFSCLQTLIQNVKDQGNAEMKLKNKVARFASFVSSKFGWDFEELYDDAPTVVDDAEVVTIDNE
ncbi:Protein AAR2 [Orchesella cincta]|uniref:Protein AAR2 homolog n=1 Tax=Orchesella cincta TaxID=48709 RepID=A0A1D2NAV5_ORCCI|nr:Protein AAR2 [Orchesella cincta]